jgi:hypothetical protein
MDLCPEQGRGVLTKGLIPLEQLSAGLPTDEYQAELAYAEDLSFVSYLKTDAGPEALPRLIRGLSYGLDQETALQQATGLGLRDLERRWKEDLKRRYSWIPIVTSFFSLVSSKPPLLAQLLAQEEKGKEDMRRMERGGTTDNNPFIEVLGKRDEKVLPY